MKDDTETALQLHLSKLKMFQIALLFLSWTWLSSPFVLEWTDGYRNGLTEFVAYLALFSIISGILLAASAQSRQEALKIIFVPSLFVLSAAFGRFLTGFDLSEFAFMGVVIAPVWLTEILRVRAERFRLRLSGLAFLTQHVLSLGFMLTAFMGSGSVDIMFLWYGSYVACFILFFCQLQGLKSSLKREQIPLSEPTLSTL